MAYRFKMTNRIDKALLRTGAEQFDHALANLDDPDEPTGIHGTRKCIKRLRALLRLARPGLDKSDYQRIDHKLRDAGRALSATRDRDVLRATTAELSAGTPHLRPALRTISSALTEPGRTSGDAPRSTILHDARELLKAAATEWQALQFASHSFTTVADGLARGLRDVRRALHATDNGEEEAFHDLRKAVQRHWRHMRLVEAGWPAYFAARAEEAKAISELLGKAQDLTLLLRHLRDEDAALAGSTHEPFDEVRQAVEHRRAALQETARSRTRRLVAERPRDHARRAEEYWTAALELHKAEPLPDAVAQEQSPAKNSQPHPSNREAASDRPTAAAATPRKRSSRTKQASPTRAGPSKSARKPTG